MLQKIARLWLGTLAVCTLCLTASPSSAQPFYRSGEISVAIERGFGIHYSSASTEVGGQEFDASYTAIGLGWAGAISPFHHSRAAIDGFVTDQLSLGGSIGFFTQSGDAEGDGFIFSPRVGYAVPLNDTFTFWPRGGLTYWDREATNVLAISGEGMFVISPTPSWGILLGLTLDLGFTGENGDGDYTEFSLGFPAVGIMGTF